ncbi:MAG: nickel-responsive transcriptional regulator NikR [Candidatus Firestonebacteria bacterium]|nr:nickel-responsive transcriptional regulator NikR [Candidatus Firestonebacteria bacterium]
MAGVVRFGVSIEEGLIRKFDKYIEQKNYSNRSEAIRDLIRKNLIEEEWAKEGQVACGIVIVYDHHKRELVNKLMDIQHDYSEVIISTQHVHLDHDNCLEIVAAKGNVKRVEQLANKMSSLKGVKHCSAAKTTSGLKL